MIGSDIEEEQLTRNRGSTDGFYQSPLQNSMGKEGEATISGILKKKSVFWKTRKFELVGQELSYYYDGEVTARGSIPFKFCKACTLHIYDESQKAFSEIEDEIQLKLFPHEVRYFNLSCDWYDGTTRKYELAFSDQELKNWRKWLLSIIRVIFCPKVDPSIPEGEKLSRYPLHDARVSLETGDIVLLQGAAKEQRALFREDDRVGIFIREDEESEFVVWKDPQNRKLESIAWQDLDQVPYARILVRKLKFESFDVDRAAINALSTPTVLEFLTAADKFAEYENFPPSIFDYMQLFCDKPELTDPKQDFSPANFISACLCKLGVFRSEATKMTFSLRDFEGEKLPFRRGISLGTIKRVLPSPEFE